MTQKLQKIRNPQAISTDEHCFCRTSGLEVLKGKQVMAESVPNPEAYRWITLWLR